MKKNKLFFGVIAILFLVLGIGFGLLRWNSPAKPSNPYSSEVLFSKVMTDQGGHSESLSKWKGKGLVVNFWATWCPPCVEEMPELSALQNEIASKNIQIIGIGIDSAANIIEFSKKHQIEYPLYTGGSDASELSRTLGNQAGGLPFTVLVAPDGSVRKTYLGRLKMQELRTDLASL